MRDTKVKMDSRGLKRLRRKAKSLKEKHSQLLRIKKMNTTTRAIHVLFLRLIQLLNLSKYHDIYSSSYFQFSEALKGDHKQLHKNGFYSKALAKVALNNIIISKIDIFKFAKEFTRQRILDAQLSSLKADYITNQTPISKTKYDRQLQKYEEAILHQEGKKESDHNEVVNVISKYLNKPINPKEIKTFEVFQTLNNIRTDVDNRGKRSSK